jgi:hypothetical protein
MVPATFSLVFLLFSVYTVITEGLLGFWTEHTSHSLWGNQIWFDLLIGLSIGWVLILPSAKALGMQVKLWLLLIFATGNIGFLAMLARLMWLRENVKK